MRGRWSGILIAIVLGLQACGSEPPPPTPSPALPTDWPTQQGTAVRQVPMPAGQLLGYLPELTAGHVLCTAPAPEDWTTALQGEVRAEVFLTDRCHVVSARFELTARLSNDLVTGSDTVAGRRARVDRQQAASDLDVELVTEEVAKRYPGLRPTLSVTVRLREVTATDEQGQTGQIAKTLAEAMLRRAGGAGPELPPLNDKGEITPLTPRPPVPGLGVADQPYPVAAEQLCLILREALGGVPVAEPRGVCTLSTRTTRVVATLTQASRDRGYQGSVAGRPVARDGAEQVWIGLRDDSAQQVHLAGPVPEEVLAAIVPRLTGR
ncbi:hypothetical protein [Crossiella sp. CA198]|uniref:hypothetical protein n=1 Tax=Crossiella sp. CA198 TaxID=3455607 RepID=UPI003F8D5987